MTGARCDALRSNNRPFNAATCAAATSLDAVRQRRAQFVLQFAMNRNRRRRAFVRRKQRALCDDETHRVSDAPRPMLASLRTDIRSKRHAACHAVRPAAPGGFASIAFTRTSQRSPRRLMRGTRAVLKQT
ncbi:hypothetical protein WS71_09515 [Burkholderia mayonis]|uniref:Uncharacterized protein n=1 Tax=Burkholderia mayonis TaxID=1385591 RepID=A0A1B4FV33_9BURK|nr:hypothetical protein WS71_09515 [Burkholderia mayonis]KVE56490.1 hypothetical protein WS71_28555 [Burkholderia mayonis]